MSQTELPGLIYVHIGRAILMVLLSFQISSLPAQENTDPEWHYLGQDPPGLCPEIFAPGIISGQGRIHSFPGISPDGKEIYWMTLPPKIVYVQYINNSWTLPGTPSFARDIICLRPSVSFDNRRIYFNAVLPGGYGSLDIWYVERTDTAYSQPINIGPPVNTEKFEAQQSFTDEGTVYYTGTVNGKRWKRGIMRARYENGYFLTPEILDFPINIRDTLAVDYTPFIARDESYLLFSSNRHNPGLEECRIYISYRRKDNTWTEPIDLNLLMEFYADSRDPAVSPDGKYLFFSSGRNIYWVSTKLLNGISADE